MIKKQGAFIAAMDVSFEKDRAVVVFGEVQNGVLRVVDMATIERSADVDAEFAKLEASNLERSPRFGR